MAVGNYLFRATQRGYAYSGTATLGAGQVPRPSLKSARPILPALENLKAFREKERRTHQVPWSFPTATMPSGTWLSLPMAAGSLAGERDATCAQSAAAREYAEVSKTVGQSRRQNPEQYARDMISLAASMARLCPLRLIKGSQTVKRHRLDILFGKRFDADDPHAQATHRLRCAIRIGRRIVDRRRGKNVGQLPARGDSKSHPVHTIEWSCRKESSAIFRKHFQTTRRRQVLVILSIIERPTEVPPSAKNEADITRIGPPREKIMAG